jgi:hypothetical protein
LAQAYTADELLQFYADLKAKGVDLKLFPHACSGMRAREWAAHQFPKIAGSKKGDMNDAISIALFVRHCNDVSLANPPGSFRRCQRREYGNAVIKRANKILNAVRRNDYSHEMFPDIVRLGKHINKEINHPFGKKKEKPIAAVSIAALIAGEHDGKPVIYVRNGKPPGARFWLRVVMKMTPFHQNGGIARSNLMKHTFPKFLRKVSKRYRASCPKKIKFAHHDEKQRAVCLASKKEFRAILLKAYRAGVKNAQENGFIPFDPMENGG